MLLLLLGLLLGLSTSSPPELVINGDFSNGTYGWDISPPGQVQNGQLCVDVAANKINAFVATAHSFVLTKNDVYTLQFVASSSIGQTIRVQTPDAPLDPNLREGIALTTSMHPFSLTFSPANQAPNATLDFNFNGTSVDSVVCLTDVSLRRIDRSEFVQDSGPAIKINQLGFLPLGPKTATVVSKTSTPIPWTLLDRKGGVVTQGTTTSWGLDETSGEQVSTLDFSTVTQEGHGYTLTTSEGAKSFPFSISSSLFAPLRQDALQFFYQQRSGIAIEAALVGAEYARAAGHVGTYPNQGDTSVPCQRKADAIEAYGEPWGCAYELNVTQGWYDAGDQGKYVVNGGIATAQLLMTFERRLYAKGVPQNSDPLGDGSLRIPERRNGVPDILDEAKWELDFMLKMRVPVGSPPQLINGQMLDVAGLVHHKMHDNEWTPLPTDPSLDDKRRELHRPSTAATLNLVACTAQAARLFKPYDAAYAATLLDAARNSYSAAKLHPAIYAPGADWDLGGGAYSDDDVSDEFYWAAAELFLTTSEEQYSQDVQASTWHTADVADIFPKGGFSWGFVAALGRLDLALVPSALSDRERVRTSVLQAADNYLAVQATQAFGLVTTSFPWGSNSGMLNNVQVLATAFDISSTPRYQQGALAGLDYVLGRNALAQSYIRGYGSKASENMHSRLYAHELNTRTPRAPPGVLAGGANGNPSDPPADDVLKGCRPQFCYVDDVNSYSTNEMAVNWNAPLVWSAAWASDQGGAQGFK